MTSKASQAATSRHGMIGAALALLAGALLVQCLPELPAWWLDLLLAAGAVLAWWLRGWLRLPALLVLAVAWTAFRASVALDMRLPESLEGRNLDVVGRVVGLPARGEAATRFDFVVERARFDGRLLDWHGRVRLSWYGAESGALPACSTWQLRVRLKRPRSLLNPGGYDSERHALVDRLAASGYVRERPDNRQLGATPWCIDGTRSAIAAAITTSLDNAPVAALLRALAIGDTRGLDPHDWQVARINGITHLLAISGFHVGVAALFGVLLVRALWWLWPRLGLRLARPVAESTAALLVALAYGALAGFSLPTLRTLLMIAVVALALGSRRATNGAQGLALALAALLVADPLAVLGVGFWLSFAGVAFLMLGLSRPRGLLEHCKALGVAQLLMTVSLLPLSLWFFGQASLIGALSNLIAVPVVSLLAVPLALLGTLLWFVAPLAATPLWQLAGSVLGLLWQVLERLATVPGATWYLPQAVWWAVPLALLGAVLLLLPRGVPARWLGMALFLPLLWPTQLQLATGGFRATVLDVGQGLSVLVQTNHHAVLFDAGARYPSGFDLGRAVVIPAIHAKGVEQLDVLVVSHGDNDHAGGAPAVAKAFPDARLLGSEPRRTGLPLELCRSGQHWVFDGVVFRILHPRGAWEFGSNNGSCVLLVVGKGGRLLLPGDIGSVVEPLLARPLHGDTPLVLVAAHHGSNSSTSAAFLAAANPRLALVSAGYRSRFGHPAPEVLQRLGEAGVAWLGTPASGAIELAFPAHGVPKLVRQERKATPRYWRE